ncbi:phage holin family protein [Leekyejoonella antrihumi]|uniref:Phosphodiesterase n=1 Tax=Leekyejoonella antrihumi TaxID=1660198 RepID=A0A563E011_9MICO|nr:phage holin family protein [Leekyejoonella antrihumi]TWP35573.1 hypothetical protein FGL98_13410 [Leekyejoonella antrihumi]
MTTPSRSITHRVRLLGRGLGSWRPTWRWARGVLRSFITSFLALGVTLWLLPGEQTDGFVSVATLAIGVLALGALLRPFLTQLTVLTGAIGLLLASLLAQALILGVALSVIPTLKPFSFTEIFLASWGAAAVAAVVNWLFDASSEEAFLGQLLGQAVRLTHRRGEDGPGVLIVQLDGVSEPLLRQAITAGAMPTVSRMLRQGGHQLRRWHTGLPATTPAGQSVLLHGDVTAVPSFRWYDKDQKRMIVASKPSDLAEVEAEMATGRGLLADGGVSVSNLFSGDAPTKVLTMSDARLPSAEHGVATFANSRSGFARSIVLFVGQVVTEWYQARRQRLRDVHPRVPRGGSFLLLRGLTTVVLHDLTMSIVAEHMARGKPAIYVDLVDYDEVAHHAGPSRPESIRTLEGLDRAIEFFTDLAAEVRRDYEIVIVSDHGQSQGTTFRQLTGGRTLAQVVHELSAQEHAERDDLDQSDEAWAPANVLLAGAAQSGKLVGAAARSAQRRRSKQPISPIEDRLVVAAAGSLAHVYLADEPGRLSRERIERRYPGLLAALAAHRGIGAVMSRTSRGTLLVDGPGGGWVELDDEQVIDSSGRSPLAPYGPRAADDLRSLEQRSHVGDFVLLGAFDRRLGEVTAFEELVGSHGGFGGWQSRALFVHPSTWEVTATGELTGLEVHSAMVHRLHQLGLRPGDAARPVSDPVVETT